MGKIITITSGKGGTGKTTTTAAVASCLAALGHRTICVDFDAGLRNLDLALGMADFAVADFLDVVNGQLKLMDACHESPHMEKLFFLAAPPRSLRTWPDSGSVVAMFDEMRKDFDFCLIDSPAGIGEGFRLAHAGADMSIIVTVGELPAIKDAQHAAEEVREMGVSEVRLLVNRAVLKTFYKTRTTIDDVIDMVGARLIGVVREDPSVTRALHEGIPLILYKKRLAAYDFLDVARRVIGEEIPLLRTKFQWGTAPYIPKL